MVGLMWKDELRINRVIKVKIATIFLCLTLILSGCTTRMVWRQGGSGDGRAVTDQFSENYKLFLSLNQDGNIVSIGDALTGVQYVIYKNNRKYTVEDLSSFKYTLIKCVNKDGKDLAWLRINNEDYNLTENSSKIDSVNKVTVDCRLESRNQKASPENSVGLTIGKIVATPFALVADLIILPLQFFFWDHEF